MGTFSSEKPKRYLSTSKNPNTKTKPMAKQNERKCFSKFYCFHLGITRQKNFRLCIMLYSVRLACKIFDVCVRSFSDSIQTVYCVLCLIICDFTRAVCISSYGFSLVVLCIFSLFLLCVCVYKIVQYFYCDAVWGIVWATNNFYSMRQLNWEIRSWLLSVTRRYTRVHLPSL